MTYQGIPIIAKPRIFDIKDSEGIKHWVGVSLATYIERHIDLDNPMTLENITCKFIDLNEDDIHEKLEFNRIAFHYYRFIDVEKAMCDNEAIEYINNHYKKLLITCVMK